MNILIYTFMFYLWGCFIAYWMLGMDAKHRFVDGSSCSSTLTKGEAIKLSLLSWVLIGIMVCLSLNNAFKTVNFFNQPLVKENTEDEDSTINHSNDSRSIR